MSAWHTLHVNSLTITGTIHSTFTHQGSKPWTTHVNLHSDTFLVFQRTTVLFYRNKGRSLSMRMDTVGRFHTAHAVMHHGKYMHHDGWCDTEAQYEAEELSVRFLIRLIFVHVRHTRIRSAFEMSDWNWQLHVCIFRERPGSACLPTSVVLAVFVAISNGLQFIYEIVMWGIQ